MSVIEYREDATVTVGAMGYGDNVWGWKYCFQPPQPFVYRELLAS